MYFPWTQPVAYTRKPDQHLLRHIPHLFSCISSNHQNPHFLVRRPPSMVSSFQALFSVQCSSVAPFLSFFVQYRLYRSLSVYIFNVFLMMQSNCAYLNTAIIIISPSLSLTFPVITALFPLSSLYKHFNIIVLGLGRT